MPSRAFSVSRLHELAKVFGKNLGRYVVDVLPAIVNHRSRRRCIGERFFTGSWM